MKNQAMITCVAVLLLSVGSFSAHSMIENTPIPGMNPDSMPPEHRLDAKKVYKEKVTRIDSTIAKLKLWLEDSEKKGDAAMIKKQISRLKAQKKRLKKEAGYNSGDPSEESSSRNSLYTNSIGFSNAKN